MQTQEIIELLRNPRTTWSIKRVQLAECIRTLFAENDKESMRRIHDAFLEGLIKGGDMRDTASEAAIRSLDYTCAAADIANQGRSYDCILLGEIGARGNEPRSGPIISFYRESIGYFGPQFDYPKLVIQEKEG